MATFQGVPGYVGANTSTSGDFTRGIAYERGKGIKLSGTVADSVSSGPGPIPPPGGFVCVQSTASLTNQIVSTGAAIQNASFVYVPVSTAATGNLVGASAPPFTGCGAPVIWDDATKNLFVWSSGSSSWMGAALVTTGAGATAQPIVFTTS